MKQNRRNFIKNTSIAGIGLGAYPGIMKSSAPGANDKIVVGAIGINGMGFNNLRSFLQIPGVECGGLCDVDDNVLNARAAEIQEITGKKPRLFRDYRQMLEQKDIDAVMIGTPDHWHCHQLIHACEAGKDAYVEKPLGNSIEECNLMVKAVKKHNRIVQVGQWQRSDPHWLAAVKYLHEGHLGRIRAVKAWSYVGFKGSTPVVANEPVPSGVNYDMWLGPAPKTPFNRNRFHFTFRWFWEYAGGLMTDWGVHILDYALFGMNQYVPKSVTSVGGKYAFPDDAMVTPDTMLAVYDFGDFSVQWEHTVGIYGANYGRGHGVAFIGEHGTLVIDRNGWEVIPESRGFGVKEGLEAISYERSGPTGLGLHIANFTDCIKSRQKPNCDIEIGSYIAKFSHLGNIAYRLGRKVSWDEGKQLFIDDREADAYIRLKYREPWGLPKV